MSKIKRKRKYQSPKEKRQIVVDRISRLSAFPGRCEFNHMNLESADLRDLNLEGVSFRHTNLAVADLRRSRLNGADFYGANLASARLPNGFRQITWNGWGIGQVTLCFYQDGEATVFTLNKKMEVHEFRPYVIQTYRRDDPMRPEVLSIADSMDRLLRIHRAELSKVEESEVLA